MAINKMPDMSRTIFNSFLGMGERSKVRVLCSVAVYAVFPFYSRLRGLDDYSYALPGTSGLVLILWTNRCIGWAAQRWILPDQIVHFKPLSIRPHVWPGYVNKAITAQL